MRKIHRIFVVKLIISLLGTLPLFAAEDSEKRKLPNEFDQSLQPSKRQSLNIDMSDQPTSVHKLRNQFLRPADCDIKVWLSEGDAINFHHLKDFRQISLIVGKKLSSIDRHCYGDWPLNFIPSPIPSLTSLDHNLISLEYTAPCETCIFHSPPCVCEPKPKSGGFFDLYSGFPFISQLSSLRILKLTPDAILLSEIHFISVLTNLTELDMINHEGHHIDYPHTITKPFSPFSTLTNLTHLNLDQYTSWCPNDVDRLSTLTSLTELNLRHAIDNIKNDKKIDGTDFLNISFLENLINLTALSLEGMACNLESLKVLSDLKQLKKLDLSYVVLDEDDREKVLEILSTFTTLECLDLEGMLANGTTEEFLTEEFNGESSYYHLGNNKRVLSSLIFY